jgi:DNA-binding transcriptional LysR family regulator
MATARQLEIFIAVVEAGGMRQAGDALGISQPSISRQLRALERSVGGELFLRKRGEKARVSPLGANLLRDARGTLEHHRRLRQTPEHQGHDPLVIYVRSFLLGQVKKQLPMLRDRGLPQAARFTVVDDNRDMASLVEAEKGSIGIFRTDIFPNDEGIISMLIRSDSGSLFCAPALVERLTGRADGKGDLDIEELDILFPDQLPGLKAYTIRLLARAGLSPKKVRPGSQFIELLLAEVLEGRGAAVFFEDTVKELVEQRKLVRLLDVSEPHYLVLVAHKSVDQRVLPSIANAFSRI